MTKIWADVIDDSTVLLENMRVVNTEGYLPPSSPCSECELGSVDCECTHSYSHSPELNVQSSSSSGTFMGTHRVSPEVQSSSSTPLQTPEVAVEIPDVWSFTLTGVTISDFEAATAPRFMSLRICVY